MRIKKAMLLGVILLLVVLLGACAAPPPPVGTFPDANLDAAIRKALFKPAGVAITAAELAGLTKLAATKWGITDLSGIQYCMNLRELNVDGNQISDLSPLASLTNLTLLGLDNNQISDISPLVENSGLGKGDTVGLENNNLDLSEGSEDLENIRQLEERGVTIHYTAAATTPRPTPPALLPPPVPPETVIAFPDENLDAFIRDTLGKSPGEEITAAELAGLGGMLSAFRLDISDLSGIEYCINLTLLGLSGNEISDVSPLASLTKLRGLSLGGNQISDVSPLASLTNLGTLDLSANQISDLSPLASLINLTTLRLLRNQINDISPLASLTNLTHLYLEENQISDISPLVENSGLGEGDHVWLKNNNLDLSEGSEDLENIRQLQGRGVVVHY